mmetsp:Transcript_16198/g.22382  ORF Transcript_16198/g.22382 Transcript_16198/m.22382 type:complete len:186 (+) Transcript_16198:3-560(+)
MQHPQYYCQSGFPPSVPRYPFYQVPSHPSLPRSLHTLKPPHRGEQQAPNFRSNRPEAKPSYGITNHVSTNKRIYSGRNGNTQRIGNWRGGLVYDDKGVPITIEFNRAGQHVDVHPQLAYRKGSVFPDTLYNAADKREDTFLSREQHFLKPGALPDSLLGMLEFPQKSNIEFDVQHSSPNNLLSVV